MGDDRAGPTSTNWVAASASPVPATSSASPPPTTSRSTAPQATGTSPRSSSAAARELEVKDGAGAPRRRRHRVGVGPGTNVAINNGGSAGRHRHHPGPGRRLLRLAGHRLGADLGGRGNGHMVVEGYADVVAERPRDRGRLPGRRGGRRQLRPRGPSTWVAADPGTATTIQPGATFELNGDGGYYLGLGRGQPSVLTNNGMLDEVRRHGHQRRGRDVPGQRTGRRCTPGPSPCPTASWSARSVSPGYHPGHRTLRRPVDQRRRVSRRRTRPRTMSVAFTVPGAQRVGAGVQIQELGAGRHRRRPAAASATRCWPTPTTWPPTAPTRPRSCCATPRPT